MKKTISIVSLLIAFSACKHNPNDKDKKQSETPQLTAADSTFSEAHYEIATQALNTLKSKDYKTFATYTVTEFLPPNGFENVSFITTTADYIKDKEMPAKELVTFSVGLNSYKGDKIPYKMYTFPFYQIENKDTIGRSSVIITFADGIEKNRIANLSFRDY